MGYEYSYSINPSNALGLGVGMMIGMSLVSLAICIFMLVCQWKVYVKCGLPGWHCLIPIYNLISLSNALCCPTLGLVAACCFGGAFLLPVLGGLIGGFIGGLFGFLTVAAVIAFVVCNYMITYKLVQGLEKPGWYFILAIFVPVVFYPLLAFTV